MSEKTKNRIYKGLCVLIKKKDYEKITVEDILKESGISRSTFYAHFKKKEDVLTDICDSIFDHVFSSHLEKEASHDFSKSDVFEYKHYLTHLFYHFNDERDLISPILNSNGRKIFLSCLKKRISPYVGMLIRSESFHTEGVKDDLQSYLLIEEFIAFLSYHMKLEKLPSPMEEAETFLKLYCKS